MSPDEDEAVAQRLERDATHPGPGLGPCPHGDEAGQHHHPGSCVNAVAQGRSGKGEHQTGHGRTRDLAHLPLGAVQRERVGQLRSRDEVRYQRLAGRVLDRAEDGQEAGGDVQHQWRNCDSESEGREAGGHAELAELSHHQDAASIGGVGQQTAEKQ